MIRWLAWAVAGIACVAGGIHVNQKYQEREAAIRAIEARAQAKSQEEEDLANGILTWNGKKYRRNTAIRAILCIGVDTKAGSFYRRNCTFISVPFTGRAELFEAGIASDAGMLQRCGICSPGALEMAPTEEKDERRGKKRPSDCSE